jgi:carotenoid cleavage dioxygenase
VLFGYTSAAGSMSLRTEQPMQLLMVPRDGGDPVSIETIPGFAFHFAGGAEHADGSLHANLVHHSRFPPLASVDDLINAGEGLGRLTRLEIDPRTRQTKAIVLSEHAHEMPRQGTDSRRIFSCGVPVGRSIPFYSAIIASTLSDDGRSAQSVVRDFYPDLPGEPIPVDVDGETLLLTLVYRAEAHGTELLVLRAGDLSTLAEVELPHSLPPGFHGSWVADA